MTLGRLAQTASLAAAMLFAAGASAQTPPPRADNLDLTMVLLPENATGAQEIARRIELPPAPANRNDDAAGQGNGERRREPPGDAGNGRDTAAEARERGREFGQDVSDRARDNRENASRGGNNGNGNGNGGANAGGNGNAGGGGNDNAGGGGNGSAGGGGNGNAGGGGNGNAGGGGNGNAGGGGNGNAGGNGNGNGNAPPDAPGRPEDPGSKP